jgi:hypothetical protein
MDIGVSDPDKYLYHYTRLDTAEDFILPNKNLKFSRYQETNDPQERKEWFFSAGTNEGRCLNKYTPEYLSSVLNPSLKVNTHVLCFSTDANLTGNHIADLPNRGFCMSRMWAQYGDRHKGVCLVYDQRSLADVIHKQLSDKTYRAQRVRYLDRTLGEVTIDPAYTVNIDSLEDWGNEFYAFSHGQQFVERLYFEKATDWKGEREYRWVVFDTSEDLYVSTERSLVGIMFGAEVAEMDVKRIVNLTKSSPLFYQQLKWRNCTPWYDYGGTQWV